MTHDTYAMYISEWLPNPAGADARNEWVEVANNGAVAQDISGWRIENSSGKRVSLSGSVPAHGYKMFSRAELKLTLKNNGETLHLLNAEGRVADESSYVGEAPEGKSVNQMPQGFYFAVPTPGEVNTPQALALLRSAYPEGGVIDVGAAPSFFFGAMFGGAVLLAALFLFVVKSHENTSDLFFPRN